MDRKTLLEKSAAVFRQLKREHELSSRFYEKLSWQLGIPAVALSAATGATIFTTVNSSQPLATPIVAGAISLIAAILSAVQTLLDCPQRSASHKLAAAAYGTLSGKAALGSIQALSDVDCDKLLVELQTQETKIYSEAPNLRASIMREIDKALNDIYTSRSV